MNAGGNNVWMTLEDNFEKGRKLYYIQSYSLVQCLHNAFNVLFDNGLDNCDNKIGALVFGIIEIWAKDSKPESWSL